MKTKKLLFILNPRAGRNKPHGPLFDALAILSGAGYLIRIHETSAPGDAADTAAREGAGYDLVVAAGGDGTLNEVVNGAAGYDNAAVTNVPIGTGNDFLKNFGPDAVKFSDPENLWDGPEFPLDLIDCNGRLCLTIACSGIDARIADTVHRYGSLPLLSGRGSYLLSVAANVLFKPIGRRWRVELDGEVLEDNFALVSVCNGRYYGGGSMPVPEARMDDGMLHTILVKNVPKRTFARLFPAYSAGDCWKFPHIARVVTARQVTITACPEEKDIVTCLDGESVRSRKVHLHLADKQVNFFGPAGCSPNATAREGRRPAEV